uniref:Uncharacterized protein n=1 Tax=viral metagenome TaxID=1070528 RepID=A0A6M3LC74_9ZZZZ
MSDKLPALPGSDQKTLEHNKEAAEFWKNNQITRIEDTEIKKHEHKFISAPGGTICTVCNFGLLGQIEVKQNKLFYKGEAVGL